MKRLSLPIVIVALLGAFAFWWFSPAQIVKRRTKTLLETLTLEAGSGRGGRHLSGYTFSALLGPVVELESPSIEQANGSFPRSDMESAFSWLCDEAKQSRFDLEDIHSITVDGDRAEVAFSLNALVELPSYRPADGLYEVSFQWRKEKDGWRLARATWLEK
jgi:hypothetical protein